LQGFVFVRGKLSWQFRFP